ncbi:putative E3 ubiquitin-protein ligase LIN-1 [Ananas comosus]|uniref:RING-type E3 ubiquitin transferase n=1 Tax=Ananas comosus TaxID=4615 RepID=A0A6P5FP49_ANACO|nr:putative E3 ubiquitin-protein ligase LIN-1 [Ananas comosus]
MSARHVSRCRGAGRCRPRTASRVVKPYARNFKSTNPAAYLPIYPPFRLPKRGEKPPTPTSAAILRHASAFLDDALSNPDLRRASSPPRGRRFPSSSSSSSASAEAAAAPLLQALSLLSQALDSGDRGGGGGGGAATPSRPSPAALRAAEKLLLSLPAATPLSALLLALAAASRRRPAAAAAALLDLFALDPALARHEVAPALFEDLFVPHLLPITRRFADQRARILSSPSAAAGRSAGAEEDEGRSAAMAAAAVLSRMSGEQAAELKDLERGYEEVLDANSRVYAQCLKKILESGDQPSDTQGPPELIWTRISGETKEIKEAIVEVVDDDDGDDDDDDKEEVGEEMRSEIGLRNGRYNPIWAEADQSIESFSRQTTGKLRNVAKYPSLYPQRVSPHLLFREPSNGDNYSANLRSQRSLAKSPPLYPHLFARQTSNADRSSEANFVSHRSPSVSFDENYSEDSSEIEADMEERNTPTALLQNKRIHFQIKMQGFAEPACPPSPPMVDSDKILASGRQTPPKDFVCPITSQLFNDPVTLETGQTYERKAILEWLERGNSTCPITRQQLHSTQLPKTNYVLKRLIASWQDQHPYSTPARMETPPPKSASDTNQLGHAPSPTSVISQASFDRRSGDLSLALSRLCTSEDLSESEMAVLQIEWLLREASGEARVLTALSKPAVVNGFVEILFNSVNPQVLRVAVFLLSELASKDKLVVQTLTRVDSDVDCMVALFKKGLIEAVVLIYLLSPSLERLIEMDMAEALLMAIKKREDDQFQMCVKPKTASVFLLGQILREDHKNASLIVSSMISERVIESVIASLESELVEERTAAVGILLRGMEEDGHCRNVIAEKVVLVPVLESFLVVSDVEQFEIVQFLYELVKLSRRSCIERLLRIIKDGGAFSMMHTLLVYLQTALQEQLPIIAGLLLQLDLLVEPRKMSIYREEAIDALISCLKCDFPRIQLLAAETILALQGRFSASGRSLARAFLLKHARMNKRYRALMRAEQMGNALEDSEDNLEEEKAANEWERKIAYSLASHEFGLLFEALAEGLKSRDLELFSACLISATWLIHMLSFLPDTGVRGAARVCLLRQFISILKSARHTDERVFAMLALRNFMHDPEGMHDVTLHIKDVVKTLRELKKSSVLAYDMLKLLSDGQESSVDMWSHKELVQVDCATNGEVLSIIYHKHLIFSGHSDGTIKVWEGSDRLLHPVNEFREHSKAVTSLAISNSGERLYSGSLDKFIRVWAIRDRDLHCVEVHDTKEQVHNLIVSNTIACFTPQGAGVKLLPWNGNSKLLNPNKHVRSLVQVQGKLYCGCNDSSIQEIDLASGTLATVQSGNKRLLGKASPIYAVQVHDGLLYSGSTSADGGAVKIWSTSNYNLVGSIPSMMEVRSMVISAELIYLGSKVGVVEIWSKEKLTKIGALQIGTNSRVQCMALDADGEVLVVGTSDGKIQAWGFA